MSSVSFCVTGESIVLCHSGTNLSFTHVPSQTYWEKFIDRAVFRNSTFGDENLRCAFLGALALFVRDNPKTKILSTDTFKRLCRRVSTYQGQRELSILDPGELDDLMMRIIGELDRILKRTVL